MDVEWIHFFLRPCVQDDICLLQLYAHMQSSFKHVFQNCTFSKVNKTQVCISWSTAQQIAHYVICGHTIRIVMYHSDHLFYFMRLVLCCSLNLRHTVAFISRDQLFQLWLHIFSPLTSLIFMLNLIFIIIDMYNATHHLGLLQWQKVLLLNI